MPPTNKTNAASLIRYEYRNRRVEDSFFGAGTSTNSMYEAVTALAKGMPEAMGLEDSDNIVLLPILRGGLPMWEGFRHFFRNPKTGFILASRTIDSGLVEISSKLPDCDWTDKTVVILDTILATGGSLTAVTKQLESNTQGAAGVHFCCCYASPAGLELALNMPLFQKVLVWKISETVDATGYLQPPTNGDIGKKMFG